MVASKDLTILQGKTFELVVRWETEPILYKAITAITQTAPVRLTVVGHNLPDGWRAAVVSVKGMSEINACNTPPRNSDFRPITVLDANTIEINEINAADYRAYVSGGYLQCNTPVDLAGQTARMDIKDRVGGTVLHSLTSENGGITIDNIKKTIVLTIAATQTDDFDWRSGVYDLELISATGHVAALITGKAFVTKEVTT